VVEPILLAIAITGGAGDYNTLRGAPWFPRIDARGRQDS
jgi:hypothetical protein